MDPVAPSDLCRPLAVHVLSPSAPARVLTYTEQNEEFSVCKTQWVSLTRTECKICHSEKQVVHLPERILCSCAVGTIPKRVVSLLWMCMLYYVWRALDTYMLYI